MLDGCRDINIDKCSLYGCGTYRITATDSSEITVENTEIYECTYGLVELSLTAAPSEIPGCFQCLRWTAAAV